MRGMEVNMIQSTRLDYCQDLLSSSINYTRTYALQIVVARFIGRWEWCPEAMNRRATRL